MVKIIAEIGINHQGDVELAKRLMAGAKFAGCDYIKFQKRAPEECVPREQWDEERDTIFGRMKYIDYRREIEFSEEEYDQISAYAKTLGIPWFASVWDVSSAVFMRKYTNMAKIPSAKMTNKELLRTVRSLFDFVIVSTGMCSEEDIDTAVDIASPDVIMHSIASYPTKYEDLNLGYIRHLVRKYDGQEIGYSGHEDGIIPAFVALSYGATWIERHITVDKDEKGSDHKASVNGAELCEMTRLIRKIEKSLEGNGPRLVLPCEASKLATLRGK